MTAENFVYLYARHRDDEDLCRLEMRTFFGQDSSSNALISSIDIELGRSIFIKGKIDVLFEADTWLGLVEKAKNLQFAQDSFKVVSLNHTAFHTTPKMDLADRRKIEREIGLQINGEPDLDHPEIVFGFVVIDERWYFGTYRESKSVALKHRKKPYTYSTGLSTELARTVANLAAPFPENVTVIDPCCGIGNVLVEALSMDFDIVGSDINGLVVSHTLENIRYFNYECEVTTTAIQDITKSYDAAIIDMPYNIFTHASPEDQQLILKHARRIAKKVIVVTIDTVDDMIHNANLTIIDRCQAKKSTFIRQVLICE